MLKGQMVLVTRAREQAEALALAIRDIGGMPVLLPCIEIAAPSDWKPMDRILKKDFDWVVFTSANGVHKFFDHLHRAPIPWSASYRRLNAPSHQLALWGRANRLASVGSATAAALATRFRTPDVVPRQYIGEKIADEMGEVHGRRVLLVQGDRAQPELEGVLRERGARVETVTVYRTLNVSPEILIRQIQAFEKFPEIVTFASPSAVQSLWQAAQIGGYENWMRNARHACIGPVTAATIRQIGLRVKAVAKEFTIQGLVQEIKDLEAAYV